MRDPDAIVPAVLQEEHHPQDVNYRPPATWMHLPQYLPSGRQGTRVAVKNNWQRARDEE